MFAVEIYAAVRRFVFVEGKSRREAARVFGLSRDTIPKMCRYSAPPGFVRSKAPERPKLGPLVPVIDAILEADKTAPPKQRHTAKRIFDRLRIEQALLAARFSRTAGVNGASMAARWSGAAVRDLRRAICRSSSPKTPVTIPLSSAGIWSVPCR